MAFEARPGGEGAGNARAVSASAVVPRLALGVVLGVAALALTLSVPPGERWDMTCRRAFEAPLEHLARCDRGTVVTASSTASDHNSSPLFVADGRVGGTLEKWMSQRRDPGPWVELAWAAPRVVSRIVIHHAGVSELAQYNSVDFDVSVRDAAGARVVASVRDNRASVTTVTLPPQHVVAVRVDLSRPSAHDTRARLYEIEVHGPPDEGAP